MAIDLAPELLDILACPNCHGSLAVDHDRDELVCLATDCGLAYPVRQGIPVLLIDEARRPGPDLPRSASSAGSATSAGGSESAAVSESAAASESPVSSESPAPSESPVSSKSGSESGSADGESAPTARSNGSAPGSVSDSSAADDERS